MRLADSCVLSRFSNAELEPTVWNDIVTKCQAPKYRTTYLLGGGERTGSEKRLAVHIMTDAFVGFACVSDSTLPRRTGHLFLDELAKVFYKMFVEPPEKLTSTLCASFNSTMKEHITRSSEKLPEDKLQQVKTVVDEVKTIALDNVEKVLQRGTQIDEIVEENGRVAKRGCRFPKAEPQSSQSNVVEQHQGNTSDCWGGYSVPCGCLHRLLWRSVMQFSQKELSAFIAMMF